MRIGHNSSRPPAATATAAVDNEYEGRSEPVNGQDALQALNVESLEEEYRRRYGLAVEMIKREVGPGDEYSNEVARVVVSSKGAWFECNDLPMEFSGATGATVVRKLLSD